MLSWLVVDAYDDVCRRLWANEARRNVAVKRVSLVTNNYFTGSFEVTTGQMKRLR